MSSIVPIFRDSGFDDEAAQALGKAYDLACLSLHPGGQPPVVQEILARKIIEVAQRGERDPERLAAIALANLGSLHCEITRRLGLIPNFFMSAPDAPEVVAKLWDFAKSAYIESPIPSLFKSGCSSSKPATALFATADFWWATAIHRVMFWPRRKPSSRRSSF